MPDGAFIGEISMAGYNFAPRGTAFCSGQLISIAQNTALFALLGTQFGGNGTTTFGLPDLRGRVPMGMGTGPGLTGRTIGELGGAESVTLLTTQIPTHTHGLIAVAEAGNASAPAGAFLANTGALDKEYNTSGTQVAMNAGAIASAGGSQPHNNMPPFLVINFHIALQGIFPSRN